MTRETTDPTPLDPMSMKAAGDYLKRLRHARRLTQSALAELVDVGRGTVERLENGDDRVGVGTALLVFKALGASPWYYYALGTQPLDQLSELHQQRAVLRGIVAYVRVLIERSQATGPLRNSDVPVPFSDALFADTAPDAIPTATLLLTLISLDAPLVDLVPIIRATTNHEVLGRQQAEARCAFVWETQHAHHNGYAEPYAVPSIDTILTRIAALVRYSADVPLMLRHELSRVEADLRRYRAVLARAVSDIVAEP